MQVRGPCKLLGRQGQQLVPGHRTLGGRRHGHFRCTIPPVADTKIQKPVLQENVKWGHFLLSMPIHSLFLKTQMLLLKMILRDFPSGPVVGTSPSNAGGAGLIPGQGAGIPHSSRPKSQNMEQMQYCNKFNRDFENGPHQKSLKKKKRF